MNKTIQQFISENIGENQTMLVEMLLEKEIFDYCDIDYDGEMYADYPEIYSWYLVDSFLSVKLREVGEVILSNDYGTWWGRTCSGQLIEDDAVIKEIYNKYFNFDELEESNDEDKQLRIEEALDGMN